MNRSARGAGITVRQAALISGFGLLIMAIAAPVAELVVYPKLVIPGNIEETVRNFLAHSGLFLAGMFCYLITFILDVVVAWALYILLVPANRSVSLLAAWFRLVHAIIGIFALLKLVTAFRLVSAPEYVQGIGTDRLHAQVRLLLNSFRYEYSFGLVFFGIHLGLLGYLVYRSGYLPRFLGIFLAIGGLGHLTYCLSPYIFPDADLGFLMITFLGDLFFMLWLLIRGWRIQEPSAVA